MTFSGHVAVAGITLHYINDPVILAVTNVALHPLLDAIPHAEWSTFRNSKVKMLATTLIDTVIGTGLLWLLYTHIDKAVWLITLGLVANLWLDLLDGVTGKWWKKLRYWHQSFHSWPQPATEPVNWNKTITGKTPVWIKFTFQTLLVLVAIYLILSH